jgi:hypothetical protein
MMEEMGVRNQHFDSIQSIPKDLTFDAILVLGGGVPANITSPPAYTKERCKLASQIYSSSLVQEEQHQHQQHIPHPPKILTLSAGTAHLPQALSADGLPIWESTSSAAFLIHELNVNPSDVYAETTSYDTISNAFFARLNFCDIAKWNKILIITNEFHMERTKLIFDWIFHAPLRSDNDDGIIGGGGSKSNNDVYQLYYLSAPDVGLTEEAIIARKEKESKSASTVKNILSQKYDSIDKIFDFLTTQHSFYTASKLVQRGMDDGTKQDAVEKLVQDSYGGISTQKSVGGRDGAAGSELSSTLSFWNGVLLGMIIMGIGMALGRRERGGGKRHNY